ncbi:hypothetical protein EAI_13350 [Harpegnathos saltator]|uniref:Uncharacterized protein n=1 Tax=Harpegnathos saltator TaxID=610380 RepID=E2C0T4_HARSA|nr:hypothetical protein EAI_13350 [Harpegnathos saltator]
MPAAGATVPAVAEGAGQLEDLDEPPEPRVRGGSGRTGLMKPLVVLALPGMYLFYKYSQYRREQRELSRRRVTERELQHLHHKIQGRLARMRLVPASGHFGKPVEFALNNPPGSSMYLSIIGRSLKPRNSPMETWATL